MTTLYGFRLTNNGSNYCLGAEIESCDSIDVLSWGKARFNGNRTGAVIALLSDGREMVLHIVRQCEPMAKAIVAHYSKMIQTPRSPGFDRMRPAINWAPPEY
jgi:hypothetical protein